MNMIKGNPFLYIVDVVLAVSKGTFSTISF